jgi:membrane-associated protein
MDLSNQILTQILTYGAVVLGIVVFLAAIGVPFPSSVVVIACGAFVEQGFLEGLPTLGIALLFVVVGDTLSYLMGHTGRRITQRFTKSPTWTRAENYFKKRGSIAIFLTRWLLTPLSVPTNLIAGGSHFPVLRFLTLATAGEFIWLLSYGALGYAFGSQWEYISDFVSNFSGVLVGVVILGGGIYWLLRHPPKIASHLDPKADIQASDESLSSSQ